MPAELEAADDVISGAVLGRMVGPDHGEGGTGSRGSCLNCSAALIGVHCHACGQKAKVHRTLRSYGNDLLHGVFHFEGKVWTTLPMLAFKPGELTQRYIHGERAKFVSPLALFLFAIFLMFAVVSGLAGNMQVPDVNGTLTTDIGEARSDMKKAVAQIKMQKSTINAKIATAKKTGADTTTLEKQLADLSDFETGMAMSKSISDGRIAITIEDIKTSWPRLDAAIDKAVKNPNLLGYKLQSGAYKYSWALIPLSVPFVWLLFFWERKFKVYDHAVFVTYSLTFMSFLAVLMTLIGYAGVSESAVLLTSAFIPPVHMYRQLRGAYGISRFGGIVRTLALTTFGGVVLITFLLFLLLIGIMG